MSSRIQIVGLSDVSIGYGSRQIPAFMSSLVDFYKSDEGIIIEPGQSEKAPKHELFPDIRIKRIETSFHPHSIPGRIDYNLKAVREISNLNPDILVLYCVYSLSILLKLSCRPRSIIYYALEFTLSQPLDKMARSLAQYLDIIVYPEEHRAVKDIENCGFHGIPKVILYNCADTLASIHSTIAPQKRKKKILYSGIIEKGRTFAEYFLRKEMQSVPIDMYGLIEGPEKQIIKKKFNKLRDSIRYRGYLDAERLASLRKYYAFSIVAWAPTNDNQLYAAPNKFFESIAAGVPPITAPHPQCKMIINRYRCGILMRDWSFDSFYSAIQQALKIYGTDYYDSMVENCRKAFAQELHWEKQFEKVKPFLQEVA